MSFDTLAEYGTAAAWFFGFALGGFVIDQVLYRMLSGRARTKGFRTLGKVAQALHWAPTLFGVIFGVAAAIPHVGLSLETQQNAMLWLRVVSITALTAFTARAIGRLVNALTAREDIAIPSGSIFSNLARGIVWVLGAVSLLATLGVSVAPLLTALGVGGLAVGLALQPTLENVFSGIQLLASRQIEPGDYIRLDSGEEGVVLDVTWRNTTVRKPSNDIILVPNSVLARAAVTNFSCDDREFVLLVPVSFASAGDTDVVERVALEVAREVIEACPEAVSGQEPGARFAELTPPAAVLNVTIRCRSYQDRIAVRHEFIRRLAKRFAEEGVEAPPVAISSAQKRG